MARMDLVSIILTVLAPLLAWFLYYSHHLQRQLEECSARDPQRNASADVVLGSAIKDGFHKTEHVRTQGSSMWCKGDSNVDRTCTFHNLCYNMEFNDFVFVHAPWSIYDGVPEDRHRPALVDLSSVPDHNTQYFSYVDVPSSALKSFRNLTYLEGEYVIFNRFNPGNLMHVVHDDLLPIFHTLLRHGHVHSGEDHIQATLVMHDGQEEGEYFSLFKHLSQNAPLLTHHLNFPDSGLVCFEEAHIGLSKMTRWYQYGFDIPQGPIDDIKVTAKEIGLFTSFMKSKLNITNCTTNGEKAQEQTITLLSRTTNRLILNELELSMAVAQHFGIHVVTASLESHSIEELIQQISCSRGLIAVHGSLLSLALFLSPGSFLIEIFPYAVNPDHYTPYRTLSKLKGMDIAYIPWRNMDVGKTVTHPDADPEFGGITHLSTEEQNEIITSTEVPLHLCCTDPEWLFRIYQDTVVDVLSFLAAVTRGFEDSDERISEPEMLSGPLYPAHVRNALCHSIRVQSQDETGVNDQVEIGLVLSWQPPWNLPSIHHHDNGDDNQVQYEVLIQEQGEGDLYSGAFILPMTYHTFTAGFQLGRIYFAWVRCRIGDKAGPYRSITSCPLKEE